MILFRIVLYRELCNFRLNQTFGWEFTRHTSLNKVFKNYDRFFQDILKLFISRRNFGVSGKGETEWFSKIFLIKNRLGKYYFGEHSGKGATITCAIVFLFCSAK